MEYKNVLECLRKIFEESVRKKMFEKSIRNLFRVESFWEKNNFFKVVFFFFQAWDGKCPRLLHFPLLIKGLTDILIQTQNASYLVASHAST